MFAIFCVVWCNANAIHRTDQELPDLKTQLQEKLASASEVTDEQIKTSTLYLKFAETVGKETVDADGITVMTQNSGPSKCPYSQVSESCCIISHQNTAITTPYVLSLFMSKHLIMANFVAGVFNRGETNEEYRVWSYVSIFSLFNSATRL